MKPVRFQGATSVLVAPANWDESAQGVCEDLPVRRDGYVVESCWTPSPAELDALNRGGAVRLTVVGANHPVVALDAVEPDELAA